MADLKISQLTDGGNSQATDEYVIARSGANYRIDGASVAAAATSVGTLSSLTVSGVTTLSAGTAAAPALTTSGDTNNGLFFPAADVTAITTAGTERLRINAAGNLIIGNGDAVASPAAGVLRGTDGSGTDIAGAALTIQGGRGTGSGAGGAILFSTSAAGASGTTLRTATERMRVTADGKVLIGTSTARANLGNATDSPHVQIEGTNFTTTSAVLTRNSADSGGPWVFMAKSRGATIGSNTIAVSGDLLGTFSFQGNDGTEFVEAASIRAIVNGTPAANDMPGALVFSTTASGAATVTERMRIPAAGGLQVVNCVSVGNATPSTSGAGVTFPATQSASSDANTLDDYEEGTFTPTIIGQSAAGTGTYTTQLGKYTKIGNVVYVQLNIVWTAHTGNGNMVVEGLPFTSAASSTAAWGQLNGFMSNIAVTAGNYIQTVEVRTASTQAQFYQGVTGGGTTVAVPIDTAATIEIAGSYMV